ncbi:hypothetical protein J7L06_05485 [Candidatus Bathyarchaeota archaeon]|nr:hypothetical protein [Candidatus Bathyarchaeota archaeon]
MKTEKEDCLNRELSNVLGEYESLREIMTDHGLAALGDSFVNFVYSLTLSIRRGEPRGDKVAGRILSESLARADLRKYLPSRINRHLRADAAEALIVYAWIRGAFSIRKAVETLSAYEDPCRGFTELLTKAKECLEKR